MSEVVIDKSYLDGASQSAVRNLCDTHTAIMSEHLFYEIITTDDKSRKACFSKLPNRVSPVTLVEVGDLMRYETNKAQPCGPLHAHRIVDGFTFDPALCGSVYVPDETVRSRIGSWEAEVKDGTERFLLRCQSVDYFFPELGCIGNRQLPDAVACARRKVATDGDFVRGVVAALTEGMPGETPYVDGLDGRWIWFRWTQCQLLAALREYLRKQRHVLDGVTPKVLLRAEHAMLDTYYVILGTLAGALARQETALIDDFKLLRPDGVIWSFPRKDEVEP